jgi:hypothetical protein
MDTERVICDKLGFSGTTPNSHTVEEDAGVKVRELLGVLRADLGLRCSRI